MVLSCRKCGKELSDEDNYCSYCGTPIKMVSSLKTGFGVAGAILAISAACICIFVGIVGIVAFASTYQPYLGYQRGELLLMGILGLAGFAFGLTSGILMLQRKHFAWATFGPSFIMILGLIDVVVLGTENPIIVTIGTSKLILSILSLSFIALSKGRFQIKKQRLMSILDQGLVHEENKSS